MKAILISIKPEWVEKILNGEKTIEIRKTRPNCELPVKVYIYCSKGVRVIRRKVDKGWLKDKPEETTQILLDYNHTHPIHRYDYELNGKVVAEFILNEIDTHIISDNFKKNKIEAKYKLENIVLNKSCLNIEELFNYIKNNKFYAWHINDLKIYNKPKSLSDFHKPLSDKDFEEGNYSLECAGEVACIDWPEGGEYCADCIYGGAKPLKKAPESWCYVEE
ncbi:MAG: ASCH domain-containing protein [Bacilli bacterium]